MHFIFLLYILFTHIHLQYFHMDSVQCSNSDIKGETLFIIIIIILSSIILSLRFFNLFHFIFNIYFSEFHVN